MLNLNKISLQLWACIFFLILLLINVISKIMEKEMNIALIVLAFGMILAHLNNKNRKASLQKEKLSKD